MNDAVEIEKYRDHRIEIHYDQDAESPREWSNLTTIIGFHDRYNIGDEHDFKTENYSGYEELSAAIKADLEALAMYPLYIYEHGGIALSISGGGQFSDPWDAGQVGFVVVTKKGQAECGTNEEHFEECAKGEISAYNAYLNGQVFGYIVYSPEGEHLDSCWGYVGEADYAMREAKSIVDHYATERAAVRVQLHSMERGAA